MTFTPTAEQALAADCYRAGDALTIEALAGTGKTSTLRHIVRSAPRRRVLYTAFGRKVVGDARASFPRGVRIATNHALAWPKYGVPMHERGRLARRPTARFLANHYGWGADTFGRFVSADLGAALVLATLNAFLQSADFDVEFIHAGAVRRLRFLKPAEVQELSNACVLLARRVFEEMADPDGTLPVTHDLYLKLFCLAHPKLGYDAVLLDEAQDATPAVLDLLRHQQTQLVLVGDSHQAIYAWRGARNALRTITTPARCTLTQSFRFGPAIAEVANAVLKGCCASALELRGWDEQLSHVGPCARPSAIIARTNVGLFGALIQALAAGERKPAVLGGVDELRALVLGVEDLLDGRRPLVPELVDFGGYEELAAYAETEAGREYKVLVRLVDEYGTEELMHVVDRVRGNEVDESRASLVLTTAHKAKGAEFERTQLLDDFALPEPDTCPGAELPDALPDEKGNILYVALTRAREHCDPTECVAATLAYSGTGATEWPSDVAAHRAPLTLVPLDANGTPPSRAEPGPPALASHAHHPADVLSHSAFSMAAQ